VTANGSSVDKWISPQVFSEDATQEEREAIYRKYLQFPSYVKGGRVMTAVCPSAVSETNHESAADDVTAVSELYPELRAGKRPLRIVSSNSSVKLTHRCKFS
jgi:hypothetical protein